MANANCPSCFKGTEYKYEKPKFCSHCGCNYVSGFTVEAPAPRSIAGKLRQMPVEIDEYEYLDNPALASSSPYGRHLKEKFKSSPFKVKVSADQKKGMSFTEVVTTEHAGGSHDTRSAQEIMDEMKRENQSARGRFDNDIDVGPENRTRI